MRRIILSLIICMLALSLCACSITDEKENENMNNGADGYVQISQDEAKRIMDTEVGYVIVDARTESEYAEGHINGAILIPEYEVAEKAESLIEDKSTLILVYCRSGRRSKIAAEELVKLGYTNVKEFGGIIDWKYGTVK